ncbi:flagellar biosynthesis protein FlhF [Crenobacter caeni]|uniref:Flagellar biosynthesis protein FlhF n=1 Tax=Crenobacter caeni TaxID=2705474 RepID=A0A6B2KPZ9_9NEIS|nr:flagellar biosynthesis protein FlhF [Crenobacter caeni]NDV12153.1 flagellar biosynthesis protein FlhF [Crenobacter caeni]
MVVRKFYGKTTRDALRQVREELGADALILSNRPTAGGGVEIMAVADADVAALSDTLAPTSSRHRPRNVPATPSTPPGAGGATARALARSYAMPVEPLQEPPPAPPLPRVMPAAAAPATPAPFEPLARPEPAFAAVPEAAPPTAPAPKPAAQAAAAPRAPASVEVDGAVAEDIRHIGEEIRALKHLLQNQLATFAWAEMEGQTPNRAELFRTLLGAGFSPALIRQLTQKLPAHYDSETALKWAASALRHNLKCMDPADDLVAKGGIFALVGPTGVGKTTTVAKLAARATLRYGAQQVALITTDSYRIGAQDQLRIYGKILGVPVFSVQNEGDLQLTLADLADRRVVLIDTVGMSQRDQRVLAQTRMFAASNRPVHRLLLLAANADGRTLEDVVRHFKSNDLAGCVLSKMDESVQLGAGLDVIIRNRLTLQYVTNGQRVPEDLHVASADVLVERALASASVATPFRPTAEEAAIAGASYGQG